MKLELSASDRAFADEVKAFLESHLTQDLRDASARASGTFCEINAIAKWHDILYRKGWVAPAWPVEFGGTGWSAVQKYIFARECALADAPRTFTFGLTMCGPVLMRFGAEQQKKHFLPRILSGDDRWCQGYSEPGAGSDLASLKTRAVSDGQDYVVNGTKIWTTLAHHSNWMFCLVRTDTKGKPQEGISFLLIDLRTPGITISPIINIAGDHEFNQVFLENVRVPKANLVGGENQGWAVAKYLLEFERGVNYAPGIRAQLDELQKLVEARGHHDQAFQAKLAAAEIDMLALEMTELRCMSALSLGDSVGSYASLLKLRGSELVQRVDELALEVLGDFAMPDQIALSVHAHNHAPVGPAQGVMTTARYLYDRAITIYGGTSEVQRNILARSVLGL
jgi:alkylation response protein AidB-like acyl-CoA dehydrogenase